MLWSHAGPDSVCHDRSMSNWPRLLACGHLEVVWRQGWFRPWGGSRWQAGRPWSFQATPDQPSIEANQVCLWLISLSFPITLSPEDNEVCGVRNLGCPSCRPRRRGSRSRLAPSAESRIDPLVSPARSRPHCRAVATASGSRSDPGPAHGAPVRSCAGRPPSGVPPGRRAWSHPFASAQSR